MDVGVELRNPVAWDQEGGQVEEVHEHLVAVAASERRGRVNTRDRQQLQAHVNTREHRQIGLHVNTCKHGQIHGKTQTH